MSTNLQLTSWGIVGTGAGVTLSSGVITFPAGTYYVEIGLQMESDQDLGPGTISNPTLQFYLTDNVANPQGFIGPFKTTTTGSSRGSAAGFSTGLTAGTIVNFTSQQTTGVRGITSGWTGTLNQGISTSVIIITKL